MAVIGEDLAATTNVDGNTAQMIAPRLREHLGTVAKQRLPVTYQEVAKALGPTPPNTIHRVTEALEHLMTEDAATDRPFIAAIRRGAACRRRDSSTVPRAWGASMAMRRGRKPGLSTPRSSTPWSRSGRRAGALARAA